MPLESSSFALLATIGLAGCSLAWGAETTWPTQTQAITHTAEATPAGERTPRQATPSPASTTTRAERKAEAQQALHSQSITTGDWPESFAQELSRQRSTLTRGERMAATQDRRQGAPALASRRTEAMQVDR